MLEGCCLAACTLSDHTCQRGSSGQGRHPAGGVEMRESACGPGRLQTDPQARRTHSCYEGG